MFVNHDGVLCFVDDILVVGHDKQTHDIRLRRVLQTLKDNNMYVKLDKCSFAVNSVSYLGFKVDKQGIHKTDDKITAIKNVQTPKNADEVKSFLGLVTFYAKFVPNLATMASPLYDLTKLDTPFNWSNKCQIAFTNLKEELSSSRFLTFYQHHLPLKLSCDASSLGLGAVLSHVFPNGEEKPLAYASRVLNKSEKNYSQIEKEALAIIFAVKHFHYYLYGQSNFILTTDHKPLLAIFGEKSKLPTLVAARLQRWAVILNAYNYKLEFKSSRENGNADALSRLPVTDPGVNIYYKDKDMHLTCLMVNQSTFPITSTAIAEAVKNDSILNVVHNSIITGSELPNSPEFSPFKKIKDQLNSDQGVILFGNRVIIPKCFQDKILNNLHEEHMGIVKTKALARSYVWWPNLDTDIKDLINACNYCQTYRNNPPKHSCHAWEYPNGPWQRIHVDFAGPFIGHNFMVVVDAYSKWPEIITMNSTTTTNTINVLKSLFARHGLPLRIVTDNGPQFISHEFSEFVSSLGILHSKSAPYHPQTNGEAERFVQSMKNFMKISNVQFHDVENSLLKFLFTYRTSPNCSTGYSPSYLLFNRQLRTKFDLLKPNLNYHMNNKNDIKQDINCKPVPVFEVDDSVLIRNYTNKIKWLSGKVIERCGQLHFIVKDIDGKQYKRHIDQLRPFKRNTSEYLNESIISNIPTSNSEIGSSDPIVPHVVESNVKVSDNGSSSSSDTAATNRRVLPERKSRGIPPVRLNL